MNAVIVASAAPNRLTIAPVADPTPAPSDVLVRVKALSLNRGEVRRAQQAPDGSRIGWDVAGIVERAAADGSGPPAGSRVVGLVSKADGWAEITVVPALACAVIPDAVSFEIAATLPVAGLTALMTLERGGALVGRRVLVTGASGGVGHLALQIARAAGASTVALVHREARRESVASLADAVVVGDDASVAKDHGPFDVILESVGGTTFASALLLLAPGGMLVTFGASAERSGTMNIGAFYLVGGASIYGFILFHEVERTPAGEGLRRLLDLVRAGTLVPRIDATYAWDDIGEAVRFFWERNAAGKVVVTR